MPPRGQLRRRHERFARLLFVVLLAGCTRPSDPSPAGSEVDLTSLWPEAELWSATTELDLGTARPEPALLGGWSAPSRGLSNYLWGSGDLSAVAFRRADAHAFRIQLRGWAPPGLAQEQEVGVEINGVRLEPVRLGPEPRTLELEVATGVGRPGWNRLELSYANVVATGRFGRRLGAAWDGLRFGERREPAPGPTLDAATRAVAIPAGAGIDFFLDLPGGARLALRGVEERPGARLEADLECEGETPRYGLLAGSGGRGREVVLRPLSGGGLLPVPCRLTLRSEPAAMLAGPGAVESVTLGDLLMRRPPVAPSPRGAETTLAADSRAGSPAGSRALADPVPEAPPAAPLSFVVYIVDSLRADRLGGYGHPRGLTPAIDRFAAAAVLFEEARAQSSWTRPTVATLFTGLTPVRHGATGIDSRLSDEAATLAELLRERGYRTGYVTSNGNTTEAFGFGQGIDFFRWVHGGAEDDKVRWRVVHGAGREFLDGVRVGAPFFLVLHTVEPHAPYRPPADLRRRWAPGADPRLGERDVLVRLPGADPGPEVVRQVSALYDAEVADADAGFADLLAELSRRGRENDTAVLFLSDHGEELFDHGNVEHGRTLFEEQLRIPLIWRIPGQSGGRRIAEPIDQVDVAPTLLELAGLPVPTDLPGRSFAAALRGGPLPSPRSSAAWLDRLTFRQESIRHDGFKLIRNLQPRSRTAVADESLFELARDAAELAPLGEGRELRLAILRAELRGWSARSGAPLPAAAAEIDDELRRELAALGYLE
jgi:arylsulfatase A-like enzyme